MRCSRCQYGNPTDAVFCIVCGLRLTPGAVAPDTAPPPPDAAPPPPDAAPPQYVAPPPPYVTPPPPPATPLYRPDMATPGPSGVARAAAWVGGASMGLMALALTLAVGGALARSEVGLGLGMLAALPALIGSPVALGLGIAGLTRRPDASATRQSLIGIAAIGALLVGCCALLLLAGTVET